MKQFLRMKRSVFTIDDKGYAKAREDYDVNAMPQPTTKKGKPNKPQAS